MTDPAYTHVSMLLDRSGSMASIKAQVQEGFDAFIAGQRGEPRYCTVSLTQFDAPSGPARVPGSPGTQASPDAGDWYEQVYVGCPVADVPALDLSPRSATALLDAIGRAVTETGAWLAAKPEDERPGTVIFGIVTDGQENASTEWTHAAVKALIEQQEAQWGWTFLYLGANQDAIEVGAGLGIAADRSLTYAGANAVEAMGAYSQSVSAMRAAAAAGLGVHEARELAGYTKEQREAAR